MVHHGWIVSIYISDTRLYFVGELSPPPVDSPAWTLQLEDACWYPSADAAQAAIDEFGLFAASLMHFIE